jgi:hypothetical protein
MLNLLTKLMALYADTLAKKRTARAQQILSDLVEAQELIAKVDSLQAAVEQEEADLVTYLDTVSADSKENTN